jgi:hypothetical protein
MRPGAFLFSHKWLDTVRRLGETGVGYTVVTITLADGRKFHQAVIDSGYLSRVRGYPDVPFGEVDIAEIKQTNETWDWSESP